MVKKLVSLLLVLVMVGSGVMPVMATTKTKPTSLTDRTLHENVKIVKFDPAFENVTSLFDWISKCECLGSISLQPSCKVVDVTTAYWVLKP